MPTKMKVVLMLIVTALGNLFVILSTGASVAFLTIVLSICAIFMYYWYLEALPFIKYVKDIDMRTVSEKVSAPFKILIGIPKLLPLAIDAGLTLGLVAMFSMQGTMGIMGAFMMSLVASTIIVFNMEHDVT